MSRRYAVALKDSSFLQSESPLFVGRAVAALAADPKVQDRTGMLFTGADLEVKWLTTLAARARKS
jgi:hypothetical protein